MILCINQSRTAIVCFSTEFLPITNTFSDIPLRDLFAIDGGLPKL